jgi:serine phosphatase RsbU (regulator of sigma subunit)/CHASE3 domain sensor protein
MSRPFQIPLAATLAFLLVIVALLFAGGIVVRSILGASFRDAERIRSARIHVAEMLKEQLDEETGVRGYAAARIPILLSAYYDGRSKLPSSMSRVRAEIKALKAQGALPALDDAVRVNHRWLRAVAVPLIERRRVHAGVELRGKTLVDRFRSDAAKIDAAFARRGAAFDRQAQAAVAWVGVLALASVLAVVLAAVIFTVQQYRLAVRLERERAESERERRRSEDVQAAYEAEKRVADTLQAAFSQRVFPALPTVSFSATYLPATEEARIGGDWYDALQLPNDRVLLAIGDVAGHGIDAVVAMSTARQLMIGSALLDPTPARVLERVNAELVRGNSPIITGISAVIDTKTYEFAYAAAGHPPPVLFEPGRRARILDSGSLPLGVAASTVYQTRRLQAVSGAIIVLYTDGAVEHTRNILAGEATLLDAVESAVERPLSDAATAIRERIFGDRAATDDVAILVIRIGDSRAGVSAAEEANQAAFSVGAEPGKLSEAELQPSAFRRIA